MNRRASAAILGASDGAFTGLGLVLSLVTGLTAAGMLKAALTTAVAGTASMALGELLSDNTNGWAEAASMGLSWLAMCLIPVITALAGLGWPLIPPELLALGAAMAWARGALNPRGLAKVYLIMVGVAVPTVLTAVIA